MSLDRQTEKKAVSAANALAPANSTALVDEYFEKINSLGNKAIMEIGKALDEYKTKAGHGNWLPLLERLGWSADQAERYRRAYATLLPYSANLRNMANSALFLITAPSTPKDLRDDILKCAETEKLTYKDVKGLIDEAKPPKEPKVKKNREFMPPLPKPTPEATTPKTITKVLTEAEFKERQNQVEEETPAPEITVYNHPKPQEVTVPAVQGVIKSNGVTPAPVFTQTTCQDCRFISTLRHVYGDKFKRFQEDMEDLSYQKNKGVKIEIPDAEAKQREIDKMEADFELGSKMLELFEQQNSDDFYALQDKAVKQLDNDR